MTSRSVDVDGGYGTPFAPFNSGRNTVFTIELPADIEGVTFSVEPNPPLPTNSAEPQGEVQ